MAVPIAQIENSPELFERERHIAARPLSGFGHRVENFPQVGYFSLGAVHKRISALNGERRLPALPRLAQIGHALAGLVAHDGLKRFRFHAFTLSQYPNW
jgi:hypothetical protein